MLGRRGSASGQSIRPAVGHTAGHHELASGVAAMDAIRPRLTRDRAGGAAVGERHQTVHDRLNAPVVEFDDSNIFDPDTRRQGREYLRQPAWGVVFSPSGNVADEVASLFRN